MASYWLSACQVLLITRFIKSEILLFCASITLFISLFDFDSVVVMTIQRSFGVGIGLVIFPVIDTTVAKFQVIFDLLYLW